MEEETTAEYEDYYGPVFQLVERRQRWLLASALIGIGLLAGRIISVWPTLAPSEHCWLVVAVAMVVVMQACQAWQNGCHLNDYDAPQVVIVEPPVFGEENRQRLAEAETRDTEIGDTETVCT